MIYSWKEKPGGKVADHWIDLITEDTKNGSSDDHWREASVKWDGCIHYYCFYNEPGPKKDKHVADYFHICDIDEEIEWLQALKRKALEHFGEWPR